MTRLISLILLATAALCASPAMAKPVRKPVDYRIDGQPYRGYVVYDDSVKQAPLLVMVPNYLGVVESNLKQAQTIAGDDYVIFVADLFGRDKLPSGPEAAMKTVIGLYGDRAAIRKRMNASVDRALAGVKKDGWPADAAKLGAIGFCFGGASVLELARTGRELDAVVSFHGNLSLDAPAQNQPIKTRVLALHGDADPYVPAKQVTAFEDEMRAANIDWQLVSFGGAVHSFSDPDAHDAGKAEYNPKVAKRAFGMMDDFLGEAFAAAPAP